MNYKIAKTMLVLCVVYLIGFYILKFIFPELLLQVITSSTIIKFSNFINSWKGFEYILTGITLFITFYLFACASSGKFKFSFLIVLIMIGFVIIETLVCDFLPELYTHTSICLMLITSLICKGNLRYTVISFTLHGYLSQFLMSIRGFETIIVQVSEIGFLTGIVLTLEMYVWLALLALLFYFKEKKMSKFVPPYLNKHTQKFKRELIIAERKELKAKKDYEYAQEYSILCKKQYEEAVNSEKNENK